MYCRVLKPFRSSVWGFGFRVSGHEFSTIQYILSLLLCPCICFGFLSCYALMFGIFVSCLLVCAACRQSSKHFTGPTDPKLNNKPQVLCILETLNPGTRTSSTPRIGKAMATTAKWWKALVGHGGSGCFFRLQGLWLKACSKGTPYKHAKLPNPKLKTYLNSPEAHSRLSIECLGLL